MSKVCSRATARNARSEFELMECLLSFLGSQGYRVRVEVPNLGQSADIVATRGRWVTFIEAKVRDWRRALAQCEAHVHVADYICIAIGTHKPRDSSIRLATDRGYGVIGFDSGGKACRWLMGPRLNRDLWLPERRRWARNLREIQHAD
jgi:G:T-mismatch repair DNA endonuclease (very short patch repair protein)